MSTYPDGMHPTRRLSPTYPGCESRQRAAGIGKHGYNGAEACASGSPNTNASGPICMQSTAYGFYGKLSANDSGGHTHTHSQSGYHPPLTLLLPKPKQTSIRLFFSPLPSRAFGCRSNGVRVVSTQMPKTKTPYRAGTMGATAAPQITLSRMC